MVGLGPLVTRQTFVEPLNEVVETIGEVGVVYILRLTVPSPVLVSSVCPTLNPNNFSARGNILEVTTFDKLLVAIGTILHPEICSFDFRICHRLSDQFRVAIEVDRVVDVLFGDEVVVFSH